MSNSMEEIKTIPTISFKEFKRIRNPKRGDIYQVLDEVDIMWTGTEWVYMFDALKNLIHSELYNEFLHMDQETSEELKQEVEQEVTFSYNGSAFPSENNVTVKATPLEGDITWSNPVKGAGDFWFNQTDLDEMKKHVINPNKVDNKCKSWDTLGKHTFYKPGIDIKIVDLNKTGKELQRNSDKEHEMHRLATRNLAKEVAKNLQESDASSEDLIEDKLFTELSESLRHNVRKEFDDNFDEYVDDLYHDWKEEIMKHDAFLILKDELITVDVIDPDDDRNVILLFYHGKKRIAEWVESLSWFPGNDSKAIEFDNWVKHTDGVFINNTLYEKLCEHLDKCNK